jgi:hypothetical protein
MDDLSHSDKKHSDKKGQSANCDNTNVNLNDINQIQRQNQAVGNTIDTAATLNGESLTGDEALNALTGNGDGTGGLLNLDRNIINICINSNDNTLTGTFTAEQSQPPLPPCAGAEDIEACYQQFLNDNQLRLLDIALFDGIEVTIAGNTIILHSFEDICFALQGLTFPQLEEVLIEINLAAGIAISIDIEPLFFACIAEALGIPVPPV